MPILLVTDTCTRVLSTPGFSIIDPSGTHMEVVRLEITAERAGGGPRWIDARAFGPSKGKREISELFRADSDRTPPLWISTQVNQFLADLKKLR